MSSAFRNAHKLLVGDEDMIDMLTCSENYHSYEFSLIEKQTKWTTAVACDLEHIVKQINSIIQTDFTEIKSNCAEADEMIASLLQSRNDLRARITDEMVPKSVLLLTQKEMEGYQELIRTLNLQQIQNESTAQVSDTREIARWKMGCQ